MQERDINANWVAAEIRADTLNVWAMQNARAVNSATAGRTREGMETDLLTLIEDWLVPGHVTEVVACGPSESALLPVPAKPLEIPARPVTTRDRRVALSWLPGLAQNEPPAIMQGPETRIAGFLSSNAGWDGVICLPGAETVWAHVSAGEIVSFQCFITPSLVRVLSNDPLLVASVEDAGWDELAFADAVSDTISRPERLAAHLAGIAARRRLAGQTQMISRAQIWGFLIGAELAAARPYWLGQQLAVIGNADSAEAYHRALSLQGAPSMVANDTDTLLRGINARRNVYLYQYDNRSI